MRKVTAILLVVMASVVLATSASVQTSFADDRAKILGTWKLVSYEMEIQATGARNFPQGKNAKGFMIFTPEGRTALFITGEGRNAPKTDQDRADLFKSLIAYTISIVARGRPVLGAKPHGIVSLVSIHVNDPLTESYAALPYRSHMPDRLHEGSPEQFPDLACPGYRSRPMSDASDEQRAGGAGLIQQEASIVKLPPVGVRSDRRTEPTHAYQRDDPMRRDLFNLC